MTEPEQPAPSAAAGNGAAMSGAMSDGAASQGAPSEDPADPAGEAGPTRALTIHLLRMLETRMDAAGIALNSEIQTFSLRLQLKLLAAGALFIAIWGAIVLLAIVLPDPYRGPVLALVVAAFLAVAIWAHLAARRAISSHAVGSMRWFLDSLKLDLEVLSRSLTPRPSMAEKRSNPSELAS
jgi:uncharacterized membrane protein YqjE